VAVGWLQKKKVEELQKKEEKKTAAVKALNNLKRTKPQWLKFLAASKADCHSPSLSDCPQLDVAVAEVDAWLKLWKNGVLRPWKVSEAEDRKGREDRWKAGARREMDGNWARLDEAWREMEGKWTGTGRDWTRPGGKWKGN
jgi:hypothetical protein